MQAKLKKTRVELRPSLTNLTVSNHLITAKYNYSLIQERIFNFVIYYCQNYIKQAGKGEAYHQMDMFGNTNQGEIEIPINLSHMAPPDQYNQVRKSAIKMCGTVIEIKGEDGPYKQWQGLFTKVIMPEKTHTKYLIIRMDEKVARQIIRMKTRINRQTGNIEKIEYTTFYYEHAMQCNYKYTARLYKLLSSYKKRYSFDITLEALRDWLKIGDKYKDTTAMKRRLLKPAMDELKENANIWFDINDADFEIKDGKKVIGYRFTLHSLDTLHYVKQQKEAIVFMFKTQYMFTGDQIRQIQQLIDAEQCWNNMYFRLDECNKEISKGTVKNKSNYVLSSLKNDNYLQEYLTNDA